MNLIALLIGIVIERLATQLFHWRRLRWLERLIDRGFDRARRSPQVPALLVVVLMVVFLALPVFLVTFLLGDALFGFAYLALAIVVLFFSLGPKDIGEEVNDYCTALEEQDEARIHQTATALVEGDVPVDMLERIHCVEAAVTVQANNRLFAVIFWFMVLGPLGAWIYRVTDLIRRRAVFSAARSTDAADQTDRFRDAAVTLHGWLAWVPARLTAMGYAVAGHFDAALHAWREGPSRAAESLSDGSEELLARVGVGALAIRDLPDEDVTMRGVRGATAANKLVFRLLTIWAVIIAALTLYGWSM
jgi:AmpE protein